MTYARKALVSLQETPYYHVVARCVRRAWLWGRVGLLTAMSSVDLNPVRAGIARTPECSQFTSVYQRIQERATQQPLSAARVPLRPFQEEGTSIQSSIPYRLDQYLALTDWTGRAIRRDKCGAIDERLPPILERLSIDSDAWQHAMHPRGQVFGRALGRLNHLRLHARTLGQSWVRGLKQAERLYVG